MKSTLLIAWIAIRELLYEKVFYVLLFFLILSQGLSLLLGQLTYSEQSKLTVDFMLGGMEISMVLFSVFMGISLFQKELSLGSISMTLSKPVFRSQFLLGKFFGQLVVQSLVIMGMGLTTVFCASRFGSDFSAIGIMQASLMVVLQVAVLTSVTYLFSVGTNGTLTAIATLGVYVIGHLKGSMATSASGKAPGALWAFVRSIFPDLEIFNIKTLVSYGYGVGIEQVGWCALYTLLCITIFLGIASFSFNRRDILT